MNQNQRLPLSRDFISAMVDAHFDAVDFEDVSCFDWLCMYAAMGV